MILRLLPETIILISISSALEVDLTGQVCTDSVGYLFYSGIGDQVDFIRGSAMSKGGFSIIALPSTAQDGNVSRIVSHLSEGAGTATTRADVNFVVTEYGIAELQGKSIYQRVMELAQIAHPKFRAQLVNEAKKHHYIFPDQLPPLQHDLIFVEKYKDTYSSKTEKPSNSSLCFHLMNSNTETFFILSRKKPFTPDFSTGLNFFPMKSFRNIGHPWITKKIYPSSVKYKT
jgi:acyl-CoA hydrolase